MQLNNPLFIELFEIIEQRNKFYYERNRARHKLNYYKRILRDKRGNKLRDQLCRKMDSNNDKQFKDFNSSLEDLISKARSNHTRNILNDAQTEERRSAQTRVDAAKAQYHRQFGSNLDYRPKYPKKYSKTLNSDIKINIKELEIEYAIVNLAIAKFTKRTTKRLRQVLKELKLTLCSRENLCYGFIRASRGGYIKLKDVARQVRGLEADAEIEAWLAS